MSIDLTIIRDTNLCLTFLEANILVENLKTTDPETRKTKIRQRAELFARLKQLIENTSDPVLQDAARTLLWKLAQLRQADYEQLSKDFQTSDLLFPGNYRLPRQYPDEN